MFDQHHEKYELSTLFFLESSPIRSDDTYAKDRIRSARLKLNGINPAVITGYVGETRRG
jgi:hypothetical protein